MHHQSARTTTICSGLATFRRSFDECHFVETCQSPGQSSGTRRLDRVLGAIVATHHKSRNTGWGCFVTPRWFLAHAGHHDGVSPTGTRRGSGHGWTMVLGGCRQRFKNQVHLQEWFRRWEKGFFSRLVRRHVTTNVEQVGDAWHDGGINNAARIIIIIYKIMFVVLSFELFCCAF